MDCQCNLMLINRSCDGTQRIKKECQIDSRMEMLPLLLQLLLLCSVQAQPLCPSPFSNSSGSCLFRNSDQSYSWCEANLECASIGGELANAFSTVKGKVSNSSLWIGVSDLADERGTSKSGWQRINDNGILNDDDSLWRGVNPSSEIQDCLRITTVANPGSLTNVLCKNGFGYLCEFKPVTRPDTNLQSAAWKRVEFKRTSYNPSTEYCYKDLTGMPSAVSCVAAAGRDKNCRRALYNRRSKLCRLLLFTDAQVESEIENSKDWAKFSVL